MMADVRISGGRLACWIEGAVDRPTVLLSNALGTSAAFWDRQMPALLDRFRVIRYDVRGHGASSAPPGEYTIDDLGRDALAVLDQAGAARAHVCGLSLGGLTAIWLALHAADRVDRIVLANTAARIASAAFWQERIDLIKAQGVAPVAGSAPARWFTEAYARQHLDVIAFCRSMVLGCSAPGYAACAAALRDADLRQDLGRVRTPALVITGRHDPVTPPADGAAVAAGIPGARHVDLDAAHFANIERAAEFNSAITEFLTTKDTKRTKDRPSW